jgi:hypothetical protein
MGACSRCEGRDVKRFKRNLRREDSGNLPYIHIRLTCFTLPLLPTRSRSLQ